ncbi:MAG: hypothetical protein Q7R33_03205, partial [Nitrosarchaeum sp.]|nr:hypothetical protein [Nitrosarchaeum sp.]
MLDKIKSVIQIKEELDSINKKVDAQTSSLQSMEERSLQIHKLLEQFKTQQESIVSEQKRIIHDFQKDKLSLSEQVEELKKEIFNFKALKGNIQNDIIKKFEE